jgi:hypothetical protein
MTHDESAQEATEDRFHVQFDSREVELMTLDELAEAFEAGRIHGNTYVCREGDSEWSTLAEVAGLGEEDEAQAEEAVEAAPVVERRPPMPERRPEMPVAAESRPPMPERRPEMPVAGESRPPMPQRRPELTTEPAARFQPQSVPPVAPSAPAPSLSFAPVTSNVDTSLDFDELSMRPKRRWGLVLAAAAVLAIAGGGTVFAINGSALASSIPDKAALEAAASHSQASLTLSNIQAKPIETTAPAAPAVPSTPEPTPAPAAEAPKSNGLSEDMKAALLASDKSRDSKKAKKAKGARGGATAPASHRGGGKGKVAKSGGLKSGGSAYDPLNGNL